MLRRQSEGDDDRECRLRRNNHTLVGRARFELAVSWSQTRRFAELSYRPSLCSQSMSGFDHVEDYVGTRGGARTAPRACGDQGVCVATAASPIPPCGAESELLAAREVPDTEPFGGAEPAPLDAFAELHAPSVITVNASATIRRMRPKGV